MTPSARLACVVAVPPVCGAIVWLILVAAGITGLHPIWRLEPRNLTEAAAFRDPGAVVRFAEAGHDLNRPGDLRPGFVDDVTTLTPIEAATATRQREMVLLLLDLGASLDAPAWERAICLASEQGVRELLESHRPAEAVERCAEP